MARATPKNTPAPRTRPKHLSPSDYLQKILTARVHDVAVETELALQFYFWRELDTPQSKKADATNLQKSTEDALHELLFVNDRQVQDVRSIICEQDVGVEPTIVIRWGPFVGIADPSPLQMRQALLDELAAAPKSDNTMNYEPESFF